MPLLPSRKARRKSPVSQETCQSISLLLPSREGSNVSITTLSGCTIAGTNFFPGRERSGFFVLNMRCTRWVCACVIIYAAFFCTASATTRDSSGTYNLDSVVITAVPPFDWRHSVSSIQTIQLASVNGLSTLNSVLGEAQGLYIKDYGGGAALATVAARGMYSEETTFTLDGIRINSLQNGTADLSKIPLLGISSLQINRGGGTIGFDEAAGGTVELTTAPPPLSFTPQVTAEVGSFGQHAGAMLLPVITGNVATSVQASYNQATNDYDYSLNGITGKRTSADYTITSLQTHTLWTPSPGSTDQSHELILSFLNSDQGVANAVTSSSVIAGSRQTDQNYFALLHSHWSISDSLPLETTLHAAYSSETFLDSAFFENGTPLSSSYINRQIDASARGSALLPRNWQLRYGALGTLASITSGDVYSTTRLQGEAYAGTDYTFDIHSGAINDAVLRVVVRGELNSDHGESGVLNNTSLLTGTLGTVMTLFDDRSMAVRANIGTAGRTPTLNELYWIVGGNPNLHPDHSVKGEAGIHWEKNVLGTIALDGDGFWIDTKDLIIWQPLLGSVWSPVNIDHARSEGIEWSVQWSPLKYLSASFSQQLSGTTKLNASFPGDQSQGKQLPYVPQETFHGGIALSLLQNALQIKANADHASFRYVTSDNSIFVPAYTTISASIATQFNAGAVQLSPSLECDNLTNESYQVFPAYPMPLRSFHCTITFQYLQ
jgi:iron complex outermembrane receptor protein